MTVRSSSGMTATAFRIASRSPTAANASSGLAGALAPAIDRPARRQPLERLRRVLVGAGRRGQVDEVRTATGRPKAVDRPVARDRVQPRAKRPGPGIEGLCAVPQDEECLLHDFLSCPSVRCQAIGGGEDRRSRNGHRASRGRPPTLPPSGGRPQRHRSTPLDHSSWHTCRRVHRISLREAIAYPGEAGWALTTSRPRGERPDRGSRPAGAPRGRPRHPVRRRRRGVVPAGSSRRSPAARSTARVRRVRPARPKRIEPRSTTMTLS